QGGHTWGIVVQPLGFLLFVTAMFAECNRTPFDVIEGDSELVGGFITEFGAARFAAIMGAEYLHLLVASALIATVYLGGYQLLPMPLPLDGLGRDWVHLDGTWVSAHVGTVIAALLTIKAVVLLVAAELVRRRRAAVLARHGSNRALRGREYGLYIAAFVFGALACLGAAGAACALLKPALDPATGAWPLWVNLLTAAVQFAVIVGKTLAVAWLFVWVRWTLPRFRYDQIMDLGWKVMLNLAILNLVVTAVVLQVLKGVR
ncbi:MAG: NADH-quinone oxidoreductase subunit H, partial [Planctomycetes bacterium]|nr:NADH-quinone oxidoreductase subunit H [Planctomycetota bacterium]